LKVLATAQVTLRFSAPFLLAILPDLNIDVKIRLRIDDQDVYIIKVSQEQLERY
jgi:hypothetical protein